MDLEQFMWFIFSMSSIYLFVKFNNKPSKKLPPSPKTLPILGNLHQLLGDLPHSCLLKLSKQYGPIMFLQLGSVQTIVISSAEAAREIFKPHDQIFSSRPQVYAAKKLSYDFNNISFAPYGDCWRELRKIAILELLSAKRVNSFRTIRCEEVNLVIDSITQCCSSLNRDVINVSELILSLSNNVVCRVTFGKKFDSSSDIMGDGKARFHDILKGTQSLLGEFNVADYYPWFGWLINKINGVDARLEKSFKELDAFYDEVIQEHIDCKNNITTRDEKISHEYLVDVLLQLQKDSNQTIALSNNQIKGILTDMFIAGSDTSAATLVWAMTELIKNPQIMKKAQDEIRKTVKDKQRVEESDLPNLPYLKLVLKETFRLHPPVPLLVPRETTAPCTIFGGYEIPTNTRVFINAKAISMDPNVWHTSDPNEFNPERFIDSVVDFKGHNYELIPFGVGRRGCPGVSFAVLLIELALANLLYCFDWDLPNGVSKDDIDMGEAIGLTMHKKVPLLLLANHRVMSL